jgi:hypothetical protein
MYFPVYSWLQTLWFNTGAFPRRFRLEWVGEDLRLVGDFSVNSPASSLRLKLCRHERMKYMYSKDTEP